MQRTKAEITLLKSKIEALTPWTQRIDLGDGIYTPGDAPGRRGEAIRSCMDQIDYRGQDVLDIGSADGFWVFEAERRGAANVVGSDIRAKSWENFHLAKQALGSRAFHLSNTLVQDLPNRVKVSGLPHKFDIVQHLALFNHLRDPLLSLANARQVLREDGLLLIETQAIIGDHPSLMMWSGPADEPHFAGPAVTWAPTRRCLEDVLTRSALTPVMTEHWVEFGPATEDLSGEITPGRICAIAKATAPSDLHILDQLKLRGEL